MLFAGAIAVSGFCRLKQSLVVGHDLQKERFPLYKKPLFIDVELKGFFYANQTED
ncbi:hypothetical protein [Microcoleus sp. EPA2]|uniref:hypothetical protein n=1 Tax=Microcoleus sp. EPA2 TaxID=2841654 RepID=UPI00312BCBAD